MGLSRLSEKCRKCPFVDKCNHKRMEALTYLPEPQIAMNLESIFDVKPEDLQKAIDVKLQRERENCR